MSQNKNKEVSKIIKKKNLTTTQAYNAMGISKNAFFLKQREEGYHKFTEENLKNLKENL